MVAQWCGSSSSRHIYFLAIKFYENHFRPGLRHEPQCKSYNDAPQDPVADPRGCYIPDPAQKCKCPPPTLSTQKVMSSITHTLCFCQKHNVCVTEDIPIVLYTYHSARKNDYDQQRTDKVIAKMKLARLLIQCTCRNYTYTPKQWWITKLNFATSVGVRVFAENSP